MNHKFGIKIFLNAKSKTTNSARTIFFKEIIVKKLVKVPIVAGYCVVMHMLQ
jgi:hypothetical protein